MHTREPVSVIQSNNPFRFQPQEYPNENRNPKKLPPIPVKPNSTNPVRNPQNDLSSKSVSAQPINSQKVPLPLNPYTGTKIDNSQAINRNPMTLPSETIKPAPMISTDSRVSSASVTPISTVNKSQPLPQTSYSTRINNAPVQSNYSTIPSPISVPKPQKEITDLETLIREHKIYRTTLEGEMKEDLVKVKGCLNSLPVNWNKTSLGKKELKEAEEAISSTYKSLDKFREESKKFNPKDNAAIEEYNHKKDIISKEVDYVYDYAYYIDLLKFGQKDAQRPEPPKMTLQFYKNAQLLSKNGFEFAYDESNGIYTSVSPDSGILEGTKIVNANGENRIIRHRSKEEEAELQEFIRGV